MLKRYLGLILTIGVLSSVAFAQDVRDTDAGRARENTAKETKSILDGNDSSSFTSEAKSADDTAKADKNIRVDIAKQRMSTGMASRTAKVLRSENLVNSEAKDAILNALKLNPVLDVRNAKHMNYIDVVSAASPEKAQTIANLITQLAGERSTANSGKAKAFISDMLAVYAAEGNGPTAFPESSLVEKYNGYKNSSALDSWLGILHTYVKNIKSRLPSGEAAKAQSVRDYVNDRVQPQTAQERDDARKTSEEIILDKCA